MKDKLILSIKQAILLYAIKKDFWPQQKEAFYYDVEKVTANKFIPGHRKKDILYIHDIFYDKSIKTDIELAEKIYLFLQNIRTGFDIDIFNIQIRTPSYLRTAIYHAIFLYDQELFEACKTGTTAQLALKRNQDLPKTALSQIDKMSHNELKTAYHRLVSENETLRIQLREAQVALHSAQEEQRVLLKQLETSLAANKIFREKIKELLASRYADEPQPASIPAFTH